MKKTVMFGLVLFIAGSAFSYDFYRIDGFNFGGSAASFSIPLQTKMEEVYAAVKTVTVEDSNGQKVEKKVPWVDIPNQIVLGHSQGGLKGLGYIKKHKAEHPVPANIKAFISIDSPVAGWAGLDYGYEQARRRILDDISVHQRGVGAVLAVIPGDFGIISNFIVSSMPPELAANLVIIIVDMVQKAGGKELPMKDLITTVINTPQATDAVRQITDMGWGSPYMVRYVGENKKNYVTYVAGYYPSVRIEWRKGWLGIRYPVVIVDMVPIIKTREYLTRNYTYRSDIPIGHVVGTDNDPLSMAGDMAGTLRGVVVGVGIVYGTAAAVHTGLAVATFPFGSLYYGYQAVKATEACVWTINYKGEWGDLIGGRQSDAFIAKQCQTLPGIPTIFTRELSVDHAKSGGDPRIWGTGGKIEQITNAMFPR